jgi:hypothetical protein
VRGADPFECVGERSDVGVGGVLDKVAQPLMRQCALATGGIRTGRTKVARP